MADQSVTGWLRHRVRCFGSATGGNIGLTFALSIVPIVGFVGAAIDYSRANSVKAAMQSAADATALMLTKYAQTLNNTQIDQRASEYFNALFTRTETTNVSVVPTFSSPEEGSFLLKLAVTGTVPTTFTKVLGQPELNVNTNSEVLWGIRKLEVALALDNTGSMASSSKMTNLKTAAHNLLTTLKNAARKNGDVKVAIIPFDTTVNIGTSYKDQRLVRLRQHRLQRLEVGNRLHQQHVEGLLGGLRPRPDLSLRYAGQSAHRRKYQHIFPGSRLRLAYQDDAVVVRLGRAEQQNRCHDAKRQHQRHDRPGLGVARPDHASAACRKRWRRPPISTRSSSC